MSHILEYVWIDKNGNLRSKNRVKDKIEFPNWNFDGSSTGQASVDNSERFLKPVYVCRNPFYNNGFLVLCAVYDDFDCLIPNEYNNFDECNKFLNKHKYEIPWFGFEQEYFLVNNNEYKSNDNYCGVGSHIFGRSIVDKHMNACIKAGLSIYGTNAEVAPNQWEYQIGTVEGIKAANELWISRYILQRIAEEHNVKVEFHPKPFENMNGSGCHTNFSTVKTRGEKGFEYMRDVIFPKLEKNHTLDIQHYGKDNEKRLTGKHETADISIFSWGIGSRNTSIRVGYETSMNGKGYFEDRRPASNCDPYLVCMALVNSS